MNQQELNNKITFGLLRIRKDVLKNGGLDKNETISFVESEIEKLKLGNETMHCFNIIISLFKYAIKYL